MNKFIIYTSHQYINGELVLLGNTPYECFLDTIELRIFCINQNNQIVYLDIINSENRKI